ncbi:MAG: hypothetical protein ACE5GA_04900 [Candidatus Zixiibacteriota bacterium]
MKLIRRVSVISLLSLQFLSACARSGQSETKLSLPAPTDRLEEVAFNLITTYNARDSVNYRRYFSPAMLIKYPLNDIGESLRLGVNRLGKIESYRLVRSADGRRGTLVLNLKEEVFDAHIRLDEAGKLARDEWMPRFVDPGSIAKFSAAEIRKFKARFEPVVAKFVEAFRNKDTKALHGLLTERAENDPESASLEDITAIITRFNSQGGIKRIGELEFETASRAMIPIDQGESKYGFEFEYSFTLTLDNDDRISEIRITNYAERESVGRSLADLGADSAMTSDLTDFVQLRERFDQDSGKARFVTLLSPT